MLNLWTVKKKTLSSKLSTFRLKLFGRNMEKSLIMNFVHVVYHCKDGFGFYDVFCVLLTCVLWFVLKDA